ncbi:Hypothetical protein NTJ_02301 [Nesidiocoris tenuis]|uniref:Uncharacterized protein n=1 Tax=Nesidiocoris tenuis TaxID=355587 RepID=A0ABN7ABT8_9HEMI|nr:Hypothetical protein NTJ_02301 [Nesidiocoris tenuis]
MSPCWHGGGMRIMRGRDYGRVPCAPFPPRLVLLLLPPTRPQITRFPLSLPNEKGQAFIIIGPAAPQIRRFQQHGPDRRTGGRGWRLR